MKTLAKYPGIQYIDSIRPGPLIMAVVLVRLGPPRVCRGTIFYTARGKSLTQNPPPHPPLLFPNLVAI